MLAISLGAALALPNPASQDKPSVLLQPDEAMKPFWRHRHRPHRHSPHWHVPTCSCPNNAKASSSVISKGIEDIILQVAVYDLEFIALGGTVPASAKKEHMTGMKTMALIAPEEGVHHAMNISGDSALEAGIHHATNVSTMPLHYAMNISLMEGASALHASIQSEANGMRAAMTDLSGSTASNGAYGAAWKYGGKVYVGYAGTDFSDVGDVTADLTSIITNDFQGALAGKGFISHYNAVYSSVIPHAKSLAGAGGQITVIGHSLGGAIANLAALELARDGYSVRLSTAGAPRVFSTATSPTSLVTSYDSVAFPSGGRISATRWTNYNDPITALPPSSTGFKHISGSLYVNYPSGGTFCVGCSPCPIEATKDGGDSSAGIGVCSVPGSGHYTDNYIARMRAI